MRQAELGPPADLGTYNQYAKIVADGERMPLELVIAHINHKPWADLRRPRQTFPADAGETLHFFGKTFSVPVIIVSADALNKGRT